MPISDYIKKATEKVQVTPVVPKPFKSRILDSDGNPISGEGQVLDPQAQADLDMAIEKANRKWGTSSEGGNAPKG